MAFDRFLVAPLNSGLQTDLKAWQIMDDAFTDLQNAYVFRGRVRKRFGSVLMGTSQLASRLRISLGNNTNAAVNLPANTTIHTPQLAIGQIFSLGTDIFTVYQLGAGVATLTTSATVTAVINSTATPNTITFTGGAISPIFWYPSLPIMGIDQYDSGNINNHPTYAFDTQFAYLYSGGGWARSGTAQWNGNNTNYFWVTNWQGSTTSASSAPVMFVTNFQVTNLNGTGVTTDDPIWYTTNGSTWTDASGGSANAFYFLPGGGARTSSPFVQTARIIVPFKNRLLFLNTVENNNGGGGGTNTNYKNRCRYSFNGSPLAVNAWYEPGQTDNAGGIAAGAGYIDATTEEAIISAEFIKDRLIVYFERSTWELVYTQNEILPFLWQKINTELGSQSTFSTVPFDREVLTVGNTGIHSCSGSNVQRVDNKIPDKIFDTFETKNNATIRTVGIRDYFTEMVYWAYCENNSSSTQTFPNQLLAYNYKNGAWAIYDDTVTVFGYFEQGSDVTWASSYPLTWAQYPSAWSSSFSNANQRQILIGTPEGFVLRLADDIARNAPSMQITNMSIAATGIITLTIMDHNLNEAIPIEEYDADFIYIENVTGDATVTTYFGNGLIFPVASVVDANTITINTYGGLVSGTYTGGGTAARVSNILIRTKQFNPYDKLDRNVYIAKVNFAVQKTASGAITVDYFPSATPVSMIQDGIATGAIMGTSILETSAYDPIYYPLEQYQERLWHPLMFQTSGECIQFFMYFSAEQMINPNIVFSYFELEGFILYAQACSDRMQ
jgi:hypothetical protein